MTRIELLEAFRLYAGDNGERLLAPEQMRAFEKVADFLDHVVAERDALRRALHEFGKLYDNPFPERLIEGMIVNFLRERRSREES